MDEKERTRCRENARARRAAGICSNCDQPALPGKTRCQEHKEKASDSYRKRYNAKKAAGLCTLCKGKPRPVVAGKSSCRACLDAAAAHTAARREINKDYLQAKRKLYYDERKKARICVQCTEKPAFEGLVHCEECASDRNDTERVLAANRRKAVLEHYGLECLCCGEDTYEFLEIDHVNDDGAAHRREVGVSGVYAWLIKNNFPEGFRTLCSNCNMSRGRYGYCPHIEFDKPAPALVVPALVAALTEIASFCDCKAPNTCTRCKLALDALHAIDPSPSTP
jgi:hypothetical protein